MKENEAREQSARVFKYRELEKIRNQIHIAIKAVTEPWKDTGPCGQGPFTGNTRESRRIKSLHFHFTETLGGAPSVTLEIFDLHIEAYELGRALESMLRAKLAVVNAEMEKL